MKEINIIHNIYDEGVDLDYTQLRWITKIKLALAILFGKKVFLDGKVKLNMKNSITC